MTSPKHLKTATSNENEIQLVEYYFLYKDLVNLHRKFKFGNAPRTSEGFTEAICCHLFGFKKAFQVKREYDLDDPITKSRIEVKATTDDHGSTRINPRSKFDFLYWLNFRLDLDILHIDVKEYSLFTTYFNDHQEKDRVNITLSKFGKPNTSYYRFNCIGKAIESLSLDEYLSHIKGLGTKAG